MKLSILIPVYNECRTLREIINKILSLEIDKELIIVDDYSTDGSRDILENEFKDHPNIKIVLQPENMGKGAAIKTALYYATGEISIIQDADMEYDPHDYLRLINRFEMSQCDAVYGSRFLDNPKATSFWHLLVNKFLTVITNILFGAKLTDMETCYKMVKTDILKELNIETKRFEIEVEITAKLLKKRIKIIEVPISYKGRSYHEGKKITWKDGVSTVFTIFKYWVLK